MKLIDDKSIYVQERDLALLLKNNEDGAIPLSIIERYGEIINSGKTENPLLYRKFDDKIAFDFLNSQEYILDKDFLNYLSWTDTINYGSITLLELNKAFREYENIDSNTSQEEIQRVENKLDLLKYKMGCIKESINEKKCSVIVRGSKETAKQDGNMKSRVKKIIKK